MQYSTLILGVMVSHLLEYCLSVQVPNNHVNIGYMHVFVYTCLSTAQPDDQA